MLTASLPAQDMSARDYFSNLIPGQHLPGEMVQAVPVHEDNIVLIFGSVVCFSLVLCGLLIMTSYFHISFYSLLTVLILLLKLYTHTHTHTHTRTHTLCWAYWI